MGDGCTFTNGNSCHAFKNEEDKKLFLYLLYLDFLQFQNNFKDRGIFWGDIFQSPSGSLKYNKSIIIRISKEDIY